MRFDGTYRTNGNAITVLRLQETVMILYNTSAQKSYFITNIPFIYQATLSLSTGP